MEAKRIKMVLSIFLSFLLTVFLGQKVFLSGTPLLSPEAKNIAQNLPQYLGKLPSTLTTFITSHKNTSDDNQEDKIPGNQPSPTPLPAIPWPPPPRPSPTRYFSPTIPGQIIPTSIVEPTEYPTDIPPLPTEIPTDIPYPTQIIEPTEPGGQPNATLADFGKCLTAKGMVMYSQPGCSACTAQKQTLGAAYQYVKDISCPSNPSACSSAGVRSTPSWTKNGAMVIPGATSLDHLAYVSGCDLPP